MGYYNDSCDETADDCADKAGTTFDDNDLFYIIGYGMEI